MDEQYGAHASLRELVKLEVEARGFSFLPRQPIHSVLAGRHASRLRGRGLNFEEIRRYLPGDDVRNIDWKVTARARKPYVRVYTEERDRPMLLAVDQRLSMFFGTRRAMKSVVAAEACALAAWRGLSVGDRVGALIFGDEGIEEIRPHRSRESVMRILGAVCEKNGKLNVDSGIQPDPGMLDRTLERARQIAHHDHLVCLVTDFAGATEETVRHVTMLTEHNDVLIVFVHDPAEAEMADTGRVVIASGDAQLEVDTGDKPLRKRFREDFSERLEGMRSLARKRGIPVLAIETGTDVASQVRALLGATPRGARR